MLAWQPPRFSLLQSGEFAVLIRGAAEAELINSLRGASEISGLKMFAMVAAVAALGGQLQGKRVGLFLGNNAEAGALIEETSRVAVILAWIGRFWGYKAELSASCWVESVSSEASPADAPSRKTAMSGTKCDGRFSLATQGPTPGLRS